MSSNNVRGDISRAGIIFFTRPSTAGFIRGRVFFEEIRYEQTVIVISMVYYSCPPPTEYCSLIYLTESKAKQSFEIEMMLLFINMQIFKSVSLCPHFFGCLDLKIRNEMIFHILSLTDQSRAAIISLYLCGIVEGGCSVNDIIFEI